MDYICDSCKKNPIPEGDCCLSLRFREYPLLKKAIQYATVAHSGQKRKNSCAQDYIVHPVEVMLILFTHDVTDESTLIAAVLHDTVEDTEATLEDISLKFGYDVALSVSQVSDDKSLPKRERKLLQLEKTRVKNLPARLINIADKISNTRDMLCDPPVGWTELQKHGYIAWSWAICNSAIEVGGVPVSLREYTKNHFFNLGTSDIWLEPYLNAMDN